MDDLYFRLRSVLGSTADLLALDRELRIQKGEIILDAPSRDKSEREITIGKVLHGTRSLHDFGITKEELTNHVLIAGRTGAGKTNTSFQIIKSLIREKIPFIIFDWKKTHRNLLSIFPDIKVFTVGRSVNPFFFNPLIPPPGTSPKNWALALSQIWEASSLLGPGASHTLLKAFDYAYRNFGIYENPQSDIFPTMHDVLSYLDSLDLKKFREAQWLSSAKRAIQSICFGDAGKALNVRKYYWINYLKKLLDQNIILELESLTHQGKIFFIYTLLLWMHHYNLNTIERGHLRRALIIEECHHLLSKTFRETTSTEDVMENLLRESREFGTAFIMLFQTVSNIPNTALSNIHTIISHNLVHDQDLRAMSAILLLDERERKYISQLQVGQAIVKLQSRYTKPFLVNVPYFNIIRDRILTDDEIRQQRTSVSANSYPQSVSAAKSQSDSAFSPTDINTDEVAFLSSIVQKPFLSTAQRYKELGFHNEKGNEIRKKLASLQLIQEIPVQLSQNKSIKLYHLSPFGKSALKSKNIDCRYDYDSKGGLEHAFWIYLLKKLLLQNNYSVSLEHQGIDIVAGKDDQQIAIEVETGNSYPTKNILKCIQLGYKHIISVVTTRQVLAEVKRFLTYYKLQDRVKLVLARDISSQPEILFS